MAARPTAPKVLDAEKVVLRDGAGNERGELFASEGAWGLVLFNKNNTKAATLMGGNTFNGLILCDQDGNVRQSMTTNLTESHWSIFHPGSESPQFEVVDAAQGTVLSFRNRANNPQIEVGVSQSRGAMSMSDSNGRIKTVISGDEIGFASFSKDGTIAWSPGFDKLSPEDQRKVKASGTKMPH
jgi:hypothetical protein